MDINEIFNSAVLAMKNSNHVEALSLFRQALEMRPYDPDLHLGEAMTLIALGRVDEAKDPLLYYLSKNPGHDFVRGMLDKVRAENPQYFQKKENFLTDINIDLITLRQNFDYANVVPVEEYVKSHQHSVKTVFSDSANPVKVFEVENLIVAGQFGAILGEQGEVLKETTFYSNTIEAIKVLFWNAIEVNKKDAHKGSYLPLNGVWADGFWHWMLEFFPSLLLAQKAGFEGKVIIGPGAPRFISESILLTGVKREDILIFDDNAHLFEKVVIPQRIPGGLELEKYPELIMLMRDSVISKVQKDPQKNDRRIYITRKDASKGRNIINEAELIEVLRAYDFEICEMSKFSFYDQIKLMFEANVLVGPHGAGMVHSVFMQPESLIIELFSPKYINPAMLPVMKLLNHDYHMVASQHHDPENDYPHGLEIVAHLKMVEVILSRKLRK